ncbi:MAG: NAD-dependent epimerase/dehydratase family protein [Alphaproteobacteria bacterium]|nr:NAD-dependent epimerase/dehydratase family protein [Alphaproteobacteria bacterium]
MKRVLLLGGYGFIATNLLDYIDKNFLEEYRIILFDFYENHPYGLNFTCVEKTYSGDFNDEQNIIKIFKENKIDLVLHFLSSTVPITSNNAIYDVQSNLIPTLKLLEIMNNIGVKDILYLSSGGAIYGDVLDKIHHEDDAVYPKSSYGVVKLAIEKYLLTYSELYGFNTLILRLSNPYGPYHYNLKQGIINVAIRKALRSECLQIWGTGEGLKDYIFIEDVCKIIMQLVNDGIHSEVYNVSSGLALSVNYIVESIAKEIPSFKYEHAEASVVDVQSFELDNTKLREKLPDLKMTSYETALKKTIDWQKNILI